MLHLIRSIKRAIDKNIKGKSMKRKSKVEYSYLESKILEESYFDSQLNVK